MTGDAHGCGVHRRRARRPGLTKQGRRIADAAGVTDETWADPAQHYDGEQFAALVPLIGLIKTWDRLRHHPAAGGDYQPGQFG